MRDFVSIAAVATLAMGLGAAALGAQQQQRTFPIAPLEQGDAWRDYYYVENGGTHIERAEGGGIPIVRWQGRRALKVHITHRAGGQWQVAIAKRGWGRFALDDFGPQGRLEFYLWGDMPAGASLELCDEDSDGAGPDTAVGGEVSLGRYLGGGEGWRRVAVPLADFTAAAPDLQLWDLLKIVFKGDSPVTGEQTFYIADLRFVTTAPERTYPPVKVDQVGYPPAWRKVAKVTPPAVLNGSPAFAVLNAQTGERVFEGTLRLRAAKDPPSGDVVYEADFTGLRQPGRYVVDCPGVGRSQPFVIAEDVYDGLLYDVARFWFYQRCGEQLRPEHAGPYAHPACHLHDAAIPDPLLGGTRDCRGGWHDAGDMNRYMPWAMHPVWMLLTLYRHYPERFSDGQFNIPESGNGVPDLLDEVKHEIQWARRMLIRTGPHAGQVYDRVHESGVRQPEGVSFYQRRRRLLPPTDEAACALVADCAYAYLVYRDIPGEREFAKQCLEDALLAWRYLKEKGKPQQAYLFSAAALLFEATGRGDAHAMVRRLADSIISTWHGHMVYGNYDCGVITYALSERPEVDRALQGRLRDYFRAYIDASLEAAHRRAYDSPMMDGVAFVWGSNGRIAKIGAHLLMADRLWHDPRYVEAARGCLHWLLGRNAVSACMVTGCGDPPLGPIFHSMYGPLGPGLPMPPGYLCGGPSRPDAPHLSRYPARCWRPYYTCWELTEPSVVYQGSFTYLVGALASGGEK